MVVGSRVTGLCRLRSVEWVVSHAYDLDADGMLRSHAAVLGAFPALMPTRGRRRS